MGLSPAEAPLLRSLAWIPLVLVAALLDVGVSAQILVKAAGERSWREADDAGSVPRLVVLGFDGVDPGLLEGYVRAGDLPACAALLATSGLHRLQSEIPPESPVAWASTLTGVGPGKHGIMDFVAREPRATGYRPVNGMVDWAPPRFLFGAIPTRPPRVDSRLSYPTFPERIAAAGYRVLALRAPLAFPARLLPGARLLSGLGTPDLAGTNGAYAVYSTDGADFGLGSEFTVFNGHRVHLEGGPGATAFDTVLEGPYDRRRRGDDGAYPRLVVPLRLERTLPDGPVTIVLAGRRVAVAKGATSPWMTVPFTLPTLPPMTFSGRVRFAVQGVEPLRVLAEPVQIDPSSPALPISSPPGFAAELDRTYGPYATMGWLEPTFPLNDGNMTDEAFLKHVLEQMDSDEAMLLGQLSRGARCVFHVFTQTDRATHCFWWLRDPGHPFYDKARAARLGGTDPIREVYRRMDRVVADVVARLGPDDLLLVVSDHGFQSFRYGVNVNQWLVNEGYLVLKEPSAAGAERHLADFFGDALTMDAVDWTRTRAYALGLGQIYVNVEGREPQGTVASKDVPALVAELRARILSFEDRRHGGAKPVRKAYVLADEYEGPRLADAAEIQLGFGPDYRVSWQTALMGELHPKGADPVEDNLNPWSGDHCSTDRDLVPGVLLANRRIPPAPADRPYNVRDVAATALRHFHVDIADLEGESRPIPVEPRR